MLNTSRSLRLCVIPCRSEVHTRQRGRVPHFTIWHRFIGQLLGDSAVHPIGADQFSGSPLAGQRAQT